MIRFWTGPCAVKEVAARLRAVGLRVACEGTEHVYVENEPGKAEETKTAIVKAVSWADPLRLV